MILWQLFSAFFKIGLFTIGGGYAMLALIQQEIVSRGWMTPQEFVDVVGIAEVTPGPIAINSATFVGFRTGGIPGALSASLAVVLPSLICVMIVSRMWEKYKSAHVVQSMFAGIRPVVAGLVAAAAVLIATPTLKYAEGIASQLLTLVIAAAAFYAVGVKKFDPIKVIAGAALVGILIFR
ncbi:MAG TPA: chromate transporter [Firmicutes bacterium]|nr:chromate transporter [Bacillota bacterium]HHT43690.1 chromate transporter [Bacillota bacterium]